MSICKWDANGHENYCNQGNDERTKELENYKKIKM